jgi:hypothetical protein
VALSIIRVLPEIVALVREKASDVTADMTAVDGVLAGVLGTGVEI